MMHIDKMMTPKNVKIVQFQMAKNILVKIILLCFTKKCHSVETERP
jgi:hypothetical protein